MHILQSWCGQFEKHYTAIPHGQCYRLVAVRYEESFFFWSFFGTRRFYPRVKIKFDFVSVYLSTKPNNF